MIIKCDDSAVLQILNSGKTRDLFLASCARNIWYVAARNDIKLLYRHVTGQDNGLADLLSRWTGISFQLGNYTHWLKTEYD